MVAKKVTNGKGRSLSAGQKVGMSLGLTTTALAAVGGYFFYGSKDAGKNRKNAKSWMLKAKSEVLEGLEKAKHMSKEEYEMLVRDVSKGYKAAKKASAPEMMAFAQSMHAHWKDIEKVAAKKTASVARKVATKASAVAKKTK